MWRVQACCGCAPSGLPNLRHPTSARLPPAPLCQVTLSHYHHLVPPHLRERKPSYFLVGGLVFTACSGAYKKTACMCRLAVRTSLTPFPTVHPGADPYLIQRYGSLGGSPVRLIGKTYYGTKARDDEQVGNERNEGREGERRGEKVGGGLFSLPFVSPPPSPLHVFRFSLPLPRWCC